MIREAPVFINLLKQLDLGDPLKLPKTLSLWRPSRRRSMGILFVGCSEESCGRRYYVVATPSLANKSTESLLGHTDSSVSCECLDLSQQSDLSGRNFYSPEKSAKHTYVQQQQLVQQQRDMASQTECKTPVGDVMRL